MFLFCMDFCVKVNENSIETFHSYPDGRSLDSQWAIIESIRFTSIKQRHPAIQQLDQSWTFVIRKPYLASEV